MKPKGSDDMRKVALIMDFNPGLQDIMSTQQYDVYMVDRFNGTIVDGVCSNGKVYDQFEGSLDAFYNEIKAHYDEVFCIFLSYNYEDIKDYKDAQLINETKSANDPYLQMYLLNYMNSSKQEIIKDTLSMLDANMSLKDIIIRIHNRRKKEVFSLNDLIMQYFMNYIS